MAASQQATPRSEAVRFEPNVPQLCTIKFAQPRIVSGNWGERAMYTMCDGRVLFVDMEVASKIEMMDIHVAENFYICKRWSGAKGQAARWDIWLAPESEKARAKSEESDVEAQLRDSLAYADYKKNGANGAQPSAPGSPAPATSNQPARVVAMQNHNSGLASSAWADRIKERAQANIEIYWDLVEWAQSKFPGITKNEIRAWAMNAMISCERSGGSRA